MTAGEVDEGGLVHMEACIESIASIRDATAIAQPLPTPAYIMVFPIIRAVLSWPIPSPLHEPALSALALHVSPSISLPRTSMLSLLYQVLETMPAYRYAFIIAYSHFGQCWVVICAGYLLADLIFQDLESRSCLQMRHHASDLALRSEM